MIRLKFVRWVGAAMALATVLPAAAQSSRISIQDREDRWARAFNKGDVTKVAGFYATDAWLILPGAPPAKGRQAIRASLARMLQRATKMEMRTTLVRSLGHGSYVENGEATFDTNDGSPNPKKSNYQVIWQRDRHGRLQIFRDVGSPL